MSLLRTAVRASVATRVISNTHRRQKGRWAAQEAAAQASQEVSAPAPVSIVPASAPQAHNAPTVIEQLTQLGQLRDAGVLTEAEFEAQKQRVLASA